MQDNARWYWYLLLIAFVLGGAALLLYPPQQKLKLGLDLRGGTTFVYEVEVRSGESSAEAIETTNPRGYGFSPGLPRMGGYQSTDASGRSGSDTGDWQNGSA